MDNNLYDKELNAKSTEEYNETYYVQKSRPLLFLADSDLSLAELKILDVYLSKINTHDPESCSVVLTSKELEQLLGVKRIRKSELVKRIRGLFKPVNIVDTDSRTITISLFEIANTSIDENGNCNVILSCSSSAKKYMFYVEAVGYLKYQLQIAQKFKSRFTYFLYMYLYDNKIMRVNLNLSNTWTINLSELKRIIGCTSQRYEQFKFFKSEVLDKCLEEIQLKSDLQVEYKTQKNWRTVEKIQFTIVNLQNNPVHLIEESKAYKEMNEFLYGENLKMHIGEVICKNEFSSEEVIVLIDLVCTATNSFDLDVCGNYLAQVIHYMNLYELRKKIDNRFLYLCTMIKNNIEENKKKKLYSQEASYDIEAYESTSIFDDLD